MFERSANRNGSNGNNVGCVNTSGNVDNNNANNGLYVAPDCACSEQKGNHTVITPRGGDTRSRHPSGAYRKLNPGDGSGPTADMPASAGETGPRGVIGFDALWASMEKCKRGVIWKDSVAHFVLNGSEEVAKLSEELSTGTYKPRAAKRFAITSPKPRTIVCISFRDRVFQRSLVDNVVYPAMSKSWIYDNAACQKGKGTDFARTRLKEHLRRAYTESGDVLYALLVDVAGYYPNMRHDVAKECFRRRLPAWSYTMVERILDEQYPGDVGFDPGSQLIQIAGISVLDGIDHMVKERLGARHYVRYMDDMVVISHDKQWLLTVLAGIESGLADLGFETNKKKTRIVSARDGIPYLGFTFRLSRSGRVTMRVKKSNLRAAKRRMRRFAGLVKRGLRSRQEADAGYACYRAHVAKGDSCGLVRSLDKWYEGLWDEAEGRVQ